MSTDSDKRRIVVGIDGSPHSQVALRWAIEEARLRGLGLQIIHAFPALVTYWGTTSSEYYPRRRRKRRKCSSTPSPRRRPRTVSTSSGR